MKLRRPLFHTGLIVVLSILSAPQLGANTPLSVDVVRGADKAYVVDAAFDVNVPASIALPEEVRQEILARAAR